VTKIQVETTVNGEPMEFLCAGQQTLLSALRDELGLTGTKEGCSTGDCGACSVILDGELVPACLVLAAEGGLHPIQQKFLEHAALQCGVCTPGFIVATRALLERNPDPSEEEARYYLAGNLCRCTGYDKIIRAVLDAAAELRGETA
jgi:carbon-monoxide dehydrogenase small subunit